MIDSHCHLDSREFRGRESDYISRAHAAGVDTLITIGADLVSSQRAVKLAAQYPAVYATVGIHPHDARELTDQSLNEIRALAAEKKVVAIGEIGLDYYRDLSPRPVQRVAFERQLELAVDLRLPVVIHTRESFDDTLAIVRDFASSLPSGVLHCFPGSTAQAEQVFGLGFVISVGGVITYKNSQMSRTASEVPLDKVLLETDAPYLAPQPFRGSTNESAHVPLIRDFLAQLRKTTPQEIESVTDRACRKLFRLGDRFEG